MGAFLSDLKYALRMLRKHPGLTAISVLAFAFGIGLTTMMWSIVFGVLLRGLPFEDGGRIMAIDHANARKHIERSHVWVPDFDEWRAAQTSFEDLGGFFTATVNVSGAGRPERYSGAYISTNSFRLLRVRPHLGRLFTDDEGNVGGPRPVILGYDAWRTRFNADSGVIGRTVTANNTSGQIVGVMPPGFAFPERQNLWLPLRIDRRTVGRGAFSVALGVFGRLKPGVSIAHATQDLQIVDNRLARTFPATNEGFRPVVEPYVDNVMGTEVFTLLWTMFGAVLGVLLIACANVANLLLARAAERTREVAVRTALGASRWRIVSQLLSEALVLSAGGAVAGLGIAVYGVHLFKDAVYRQTEVPFFVDMRVDAPTFAFVAVITLAAGALAGVLPALQATGTKVPDVLKDESRGASSLRLGRFSRGLVIAQITLACALLICAGFMIQSVVARSRMDYGVPTHGIFTAKVEFGTTNADTASRRQFWEGLLRRLESLPEQHGVVLATNLPGLGAGPSPFEIEGATYAGDRDRPLARWVAATSGYFEAFRLRPLEGRVFTAGDIGSAPKVAVVTRKFATRFFPGASPIGRRIRRGSGFFATPWMTVVGVIPDVWHQGTDDRTPEVMLTPVFQTDHDNLTVAIASDRGDPLRFTEPVRTAVTALKPDQPIYALQTLERAIADDGWAYNVFGALFTAFGVAALFLAAIGVYGIMSFSVSRRTREVGVRMALGADGRNVLAMFLREGAFQVGIGLVLGLGFAVLLSKGLRVVLFQVDTRNPIVFAVVMAVLALTGMVATLIPARRAARLDPMIALRYE